MESINDDGPTKIRILNLLIILEKKWWLIYEETACYRLRISDLSLNLFHGAMTKKKQFMSLLIGCSRPTALAISVHSRVRSRKV